jgi:hypothetical protein
MFLKKLLSPEAFEKENKQGIKTREEDRQANPRKNHGQPLGSKNKKKKSKCK